MVYLITSLCDTFRCPYQEKQKVRAVRKNILPMILALLSRQFGLF